MEALDSHLVEGRSRRGGVAFGDTLGASDPFAMSAIDEMEAEAEPDMHQTTIRPKPKPNPKPKPKAAGGDEETEAPPDLPASRPKPKPKPKAAGGGEGRSTTQGGAKVDEGSPWLAFGLELARAGLTPEEEEALGEQTRASLAAARVLLSRSKAPGLGLDAGLGSTEGEAGLGTQSACGERSTSPWLTFGLELASLSLTVQEEEALDPLSSAALAAAYLLQSNFMGGGRRLSTQVEAALEAQAKRGGALSSWVGFGLELVGMQVRRHPPSPTRSKPIQSGSTQPNTDQSPPFQSSSAHAQSMPSPAQPSPAQPSPVQSSPVQSSLVQFILIQSTPTLSNRIESNNPSQEI